MSAAFSPEQLTHVRSDAQRLADACGSHEDYIAALLASSERDAAEARIAAADGKHEGVDQLRQRLRAQSLRSAASAATVRELCLSARKQHVAALQLLRSMADGNAFASRETRAKSVLVVDDYDAVRELVARVLSNAGFDVRTAVNGLEGLLAAYALRPDVIVMDVAMPVLDGIEATRLIKASEATRDLRVIAHSDSAALDNRASQKLFVAVLQKPTSPDLVVATVLQATHA